MEGTSQTCFACLTLYFLTQAEKSLSCALQLQGAQDVDWCSRGLQSFQRSWRTLISNMSNRPGVAAQGYSKNTYINSLNHWWASKHIFEKPPRLIGLSYVAETLKVDCFIHTSGGKGDYRREGLVYKGTCLTCKERGPSSEVDKNGKVKLVTGVRSSVKSIYWGESAFNDYIEVRANTLKSSSTFQLPTKIMFS